MNTKLRLRGGLSVAFGGLFCAAAAAMLIPSSPTLAQGTQDATVRLEGTGPHRERQSAMHLKPFPAQWSDLSSWTGGDALTTESMKDRPALVIYYWSGHPRLNEPAAVVAERINQKYGKAGLAVVGVHNPKGFEGAAALATKAGVTFPIAHDKDGKFRAALGVDQEPDFYVMDRAGNLRFADVDLTGVETAARIVTEETAAQAASVPGSVADAARKSQLEAAKAGPVKPGVRPGQRVPVTYVAPGPERYDNLKWPKMPKIEGYSSYEQAREKIEKDAPQISVPEELWTPSTPDRQGRISVYYVVDYTVPDSLNIIPIMNAVQTRYLRDAVVVCVSDRYIASNNTEEASKRDEHAAKGAGSIAANRNVNHFVLGKRLALDSITGTQTIGGIANDSARDYGIVFVTTSDDRVRWYGHANTPHFHAAMDQLLKIDPGVIDRRKLEDAAASAGRP